MALSHPISPTKSGELCPSSTLLYRPLKARHRDRSAFLAPSASQDPLLAAVTERLLDRLEDCKRKFPHVAVIGGAGVRGDGQSVGFMGGKIWAKAVWWDGVERHSCADNVHLH